MSSLPKPKLTSKASATSLDDPRRAVTFVKDILEASQRLADTPRGYPLVPRYEKYGIRRRPFGKYRIFYRVAAEQIDVLHILNGARDYEVILFPQD